MGRAFAWAMMGILLLLAVGEVRRYGRAQKSDEELPYPGRRLQRRLMISLLLGSIVALGAYWPRTGPWVQFGLFIWVGVALVAGLLLLLRDLSETSRAVVAHSVNLSAQADEVVHELLKEKGKQPPDQEPHAP